MTATATLPDLNAEPADGFTTANDVVAGKHPQPAKDAAPAAPPPAAKPAAAPAAAVTAKPSDGSLIGAAKPTYDLKAEGLHADDLKTYADLLGEHKADSKLGQAILDKMLPALRARSEKNLAEAQTAWRAENAKDPAHRERADAALSVVSEATRKALAESAFVDHPALAAVFKEFGDFVKRATKQDSTEPGTSPTSAPKYEPGNISSEAFAHGLSGGF